uniref:Uncharacterized protein n=1 Tax=Chromera velia CCMP2878 TaxID=1169474 RepID=A0A0G4HFP1_9ALVE|eukprot:Cvel_27143.t1-p1 / transcript=Cvel_27143.t1 / gene=Cvel_27143 / organism=Chromera_velia_CCMP2878 / gene_product=Ankyrin repeat domain-containing protein 50, putative / transcript_product=Ankyrin repeat domain-containing protein 50, putative / location=Cvel_scaffold3338:6569-11052(-) / protein_length=912 / sequence_SO=supercontig / SO=protein_coding / is_pseudo=false
MAESPGSPCRRPFGYLSGLLTQQTQQEHKRKRDRRTQGEGRGHKFCGLPCKFTPKLAFMQAPPALLQAIQGGDVAQVERQWHHLVQPPSPDLLVFLLNEGSVRGHVEVVRFLLRHGADPKRHDFRGWLPLGGASANGHSETVQALLEGGADPSGLDGEGVPALMLAAETGKVVVVSQLLRAGADPNFVDVRGFSPLISAVAHGHVATATFLIHNHADVRHRGPFGMTALHYAVLGGHEDVAVLLVDTGAVVGERNDHGDTPLALAAAEGSEGISAMLLAAGSEPNSVDGMGRTPLAKAAMKGHTGVVHLLLMFRARICASALSYAAKNGHTETVDLLLQASGAPDVNARVETMTPVYVAAGFGESETVAVLLREGGDPSLTDSDGKSAVDAAEHFGHRSLAEWLRRRVEEGGEGRVEGVGEGGEFGEPSFDFDWIERQSRDFAPLASTLVPQNGADAPAVALWPLSVLRFLSKKREAVPIRHEVETTLLRLGMPPEEVEKVRQAAVSALVEGEGEGEIDYFKFPFWGGSAVVCLSYPWLSEHHPDPDCFHLRTVVDFLDALWWARGDRGKDVFVFWDFMSLRKRGGNQDLNVERTEESPSFFEGVSEAQPGGGVGVGGDRTETAKRLAEIDRWYSSPLTFVCMTDLVPRGALNSTPYQSRGWPTFEMFVSGFKDSRRVLQIPAPEGFTGVTAFHSDMGEFSGQSHAPPPSPTSPALFDQTIDRRVFTNGSDSGRVKSLYLRFVERSAPSVLSLSFKGRPGFSNPNACALADLFRFIHSKRITLSIRRLDLSGTSVGNEGVAALVDALRTAPHLREIDFSATAVSVPTLDILERGVRQGQFHSVRRIILHHCDQIDDSCESTLLALREAWGARGRSEASSASSSASFSFSTPPPSSLCAPSADGAISCSEEAT